jgi:hypothetical protein
MCCAGDACLEKLLAIVDKLRLGLGVGTVTCVLDLDFESGTDNITDSAPN